MRSVLSRLATIGLVAAVAVVGSISGRAVWDTVTAEDEPKAISPSLSELEEESSQAKFQGELLGVFVGPPEATVPDKFTTYEKLCSADASTIQVGWEKAGVFDLSLSLPEPFEFLPDSLNTGVIACDDSVYAARWDYEVKQASGYAGGLTIVRSPIDVEQLDVSTRRVEATEIGGVPAVYIHALTGNGIGSQAAVIFPGDTVNTSLYSSGVPGSDLLKVAELVAAKIARQD